MRKFLNTSEMLLAVCYRGPVLRCSYLNWADEIAFAITALPVAPTIYRLHKLSAQRAAEDNLRLEERLGRHSLSNALHDKTGPSIPGGSLSPSLPSPPLQLIAHRFQQQMGRPGLANSVRQQLSLLLSDYPT